jgi:hypothetical protein
MNTTSHRRSPLERRQHSPSRAHPRFAERALRNALQAIIVDETGEQHTPSPDFPWHDNTRETPRAMLPCERERTMLRAAIRQGCTTPERVLTYFLARIADAMADFAQPVDVSALVYTRLVQEQAEALEAQSLARALPSPERWQHAVRETRDVIHAAHVFCQMPGFAPVDGAPR